MYEQAGSLVARLEAEDRDVGLNADLLYTIASGNNDSAFQLDASTGIITVSAGGALARRASTSFRLVVVARDRGTPPFQTVADLTVTVNDSAVLALRGGGIAGPPGGLEATVAVVGGAAVGGAMVISCLVLVAVVVCCLRRRRRRRRHCKDDDLKRRCSGYSSSPPLLSLVVFIFVKFSAILCMFYFILF